MESPPVTDNTESNARDLPALKEMQQLEDILSAIREVVWVRRADDLTLTYINSACEKVLGRTPAELIGTSGALFEGIHPDDKERLQKDISALLEKGEGYLEARVLRPNKEIRYLSAECYVKKTNTGKPLTLSGISRDITELRETENSLKESLADVEQILESISDSFIALDKNFCYTYVNNEALNLYKIKKEDIVGKYAWDLFPAAVGTKFYTELNRAMNENIPVQFEEYSQHTGKWLLLNACPTKNGLAVYFRDITEQKKIQDILRDNEYNLRALINNTSDFIWSIDKDLKIIQINQPFVDFIHSFTGKILRPGDSMMMDDFGPALREKWGNYFQRALSGQTFLVVDEELINNTKHNREKRFKPIFSHAGEPIGVSCYARDISEEARLNAKILNEEKKLRAIINNTDDIIWLVNDHMETISANKAYYDRVAGMTQNKDYEELTESDFAKERIALWHGYYSRALNGEAFTIIEEEDVDGRKVYEEIRFHPIHDSNNKVVSINCISRDITAEKEQLISISQQNQKLNEIASMQSHQVRGPVASILGLAQLFNTADLNDPSNLTVLKGIKEAASDLDTIIKDIVKKTGTAQ